MRLTNTMARCAGIYDFKTHATCPDRFHCLRYLHFVRLDRAAGIKNYQGMMVTMAVENCNLLIDGDAQL